MITKILITLVAIVIVSLVFRKQRMPTGRPTEAVLADRDENPDGIRPQTVAYGMIALLIVAGVFMYWLNYRENHRIMEIRVTSPTTGEMVVYEAYRQSIEGKTFTTLDGRKVIIGDSERFEILSQ